MNKDKGAPQISCVFLRFCIIGILCTGIDAGVFYALHKLIDYRIAMTCGFFLSLGANYVLNMRYSFHVKPSAKNAVGFAMAHLFNIFVVRMSLMWLFIHLFAMSESWAFVPTLAISVVTNFLVLQFIVKKI